MKAYPLKIENIGEDVYTLMSRGHHDIHEFMRAVRKDYDWSLGVPTHIYMRAVPTRDPSYTCLYSEATKGARGAFPVTYVSEAYSCNGDTYEQVYPLAERGGLRVCPHCSGETTEHKRHCDFCGEPS